MRNPFNPGSGSRPPFLAGRDGELSMFRKMLASIVDGKSENIILAGLRGTGKTVLLDEFYKICHEKKFFPIKRSQFSSKYNDSGQFYDALKYDMSSAASSLSVTTTIKQKLGSMGSALKPKMWESRTFFITNHHTCVKPYLLRTTWKIIYLTIGHSLKKMDIKG
ncbi:MAG: ATP-binding protein [Thaumarchaeota archaeon]|nr:ATP-binding protein [Nitrososphaerota archaeon]